MSNSRSSADSAASNEATHMQQDGTGGRKDGKCEPPHLICWHSAMLPARQMSGSRSAAQGHGTCLVMIITQHRLCVKRERSWTTSATSAMMQAGVRWLGSCRAASWRTWANQEFPNDTQMAQDSVREVAFWPEPDLPSRRGPRPPLGGIWVGAKPGTGAEGASSLTRAVRPNMHATRAIVIDGSTSTRTARSWLADRRTVPLSC